MSESVKILAGAPAYSPDGKRHWGAVPASIMAANTQAGREVGEKILIIYPLWPNGKQFTVPLTHISRIEEPPVDDPSPSEPPPDEDPGEPEIVKIAYTLVTFVMSDGTIKTVRTEPVDDVA